MNTEHVEAVVVGSGFGGSVAAFRLAEAGRSVVVMERGRPYPPGSFPRSPADMGRAFWDPRAGLYGMYDVWGFNGFDSVVSSGLGGGSLIYANVLMRKPERWFVHEEPLPRGGYENWPVTRADLDPHYDRVERMIGVSRFPLDHPSYDNIAKTHAMQDAAAELGLDFRLPPLAVSFAPRADAEPALGVPIEERPYGNLHGVQRITCKMCGECNIGCNDGAKNTLDHTYLSAARHHGADLRPLHEVKAIRPGERGGYEVDYVAHDLEQKARKLPVQTISCDRLVLAAGTYGTTYLLLRSRESFPGLSPTLGTRFSGNGDLLTFLLNATDRGRVRPLKASSGPVITTAIKLPDEVDGGSGRGAYIEDGGYPAFLDWMVTSLDAGSDMERLWHYTVDRLKAFITHDTNMSQEMSELLGNGALSVSSLPLLGMGRDVPDGELRLRGDRLDINWTTKTSEDYFERVRDAMRRIADVLGAHYHDNPMWFRKRIITVHPVGGAPMGRHLGEGVCDAYGEVFGYPGLYIADGAAMPGPVGPNPSLTIAAMSDRMCTRILEGASRGPRPGAEDDSACESGAFEGAEAGTASSGHRTSLSFTEEMKGFYDARVTEPEDAEESGGELAFRLTITVDDVDRFLAEPEHPARAEGWIEAAGCGGRRPVHQGWFNLFAPADAPDRRLMRYRLWFDDNAGRARTLVGWKNVFHGSITEIWPDTTTLRYRLLDGHAAEGRDAPVVGAGILRIGLTDFLQQLTTFRTEGPHGVAALRRFGCFFCGELWKVYGPAR